MCTGRNKHQPQLSNDQRRHCHLAKHIGPHPPWQHWRTATHWRRVFCIRWRRRNHWKLWEKVNWRRGAGESHCDGYYCYELCLWRTDLHSSECCWCSDEITATNFESGNIHSKFLTFLCRADMSQLNFVGNNSWSTRSPLPVRPVTYDTFEWSE